jgi:hypothetical protein
MTARGIVKIEFQHVHFVESRILMAWIVGHCDADYVSDPLFPSLADSLVYRWSSASSICTHNTRLLHSRPPRNKYHFTLASDSSNLPLSS